MEGPGEDYWCSRVIKWPLCNIINIASVYVRWVTAALPGAALTVTLSCVTGITGAPNKECLPKQILTTSHTLKYLDMHSFQSIIVIWVGVRTLQSKGKYDWNIRKQLLRFFLFYQWNLIENTIIKWKCLLHSITNCIVAGHPRGWPGMHSAAGERNSQYMRALRQHTPFSLSVGCTVAIYILLCGILHAYIICVCEITRHRQISKWLKQCYTAY